MTGEADITLKILGNDQCVEMTLPTNLEISALKTLATDYTTIPVDQMRLLWRGRALSNGTLETNNIDTNATIKVVPQRNRETAMLAKMEYERERLRRPRDAQDRIETLRTAVANIQEQISEMTIQLNDVLLLLNRNDPTAEQQWLDLRQRLGTDFLTRWNESAAAFGEYQAQLDGGRIVIRDAPRAAHSTEQPPTRTEQQEVPIQQQAQTPMQRMPEEQQEHPAHRMPVPDDVIFNAEDLQRIDRDSQTPPRAAYNFPVSYGNGLVHQRIYME